MNRPKTIWKKYELENAGSLLNQYSTRSAYKNDLISRDVNLKNVQNIQMRNIFTCEYNIPEHINITDSIFYISSYTNGCFLDKPTKDYTTEDYTLLRSYDEKGFHIDGVPSEFITSFGNYLGLKYFLEGVENKRNVYSYINKFVSKDIVDQLHKLFGQCRFISNGNITEQEFFNSEIGYVLVSHDKSLAEKYKIYTSVGFEEIRDLIGSAEDVVSGPTAKWVTGVDSCGELITKELSIEVADPYRKELYPFMNGTDIKEFAEKFLSSKSSILLLIGPPGTGKTNFIRQLLSATKESVLLTYSEDLKKMDSLFSYFYDSPERFLIIEDADTYIEKRENGNSNMKQLLNITDGLTANYKKRVIFSTNLPSLSMVDPALIRPGRCYDVLDFSAYQGEDLVNACKVLNINIDHLQNKSYTLAELYSIKNGEEMNTSIVGKRSSFGFGNN